jgi:zinc carboxypeptidase
VSYQAYSRTLAVAFLSATWLVFFTLVSYGQSRPAPKIVSPREHFGFDLGEDRKLADWSELTAYFNLLGRQSDRVKVQELGKTTEGRPFLLVTISAPQNLARLEEYRQIQLRLSDPRITTEPDAQKLIAQGKTILAITCNIHSTEIASSQTAAEFAWRLASSESPKTREVLDNTIILLVPSLNPDGQQLVVDWYKKYLGTPYEGTGPVTLYHKYVGHDNNRDWYSFTQVETRLTVEKVLNAWRPQIVYDVHQQGATGARIFLPPWIDPIDPNIDPLLVQSMNALGTNVAVDLTAAGKKGVHHNGTYDLWSPARHYMLYHAGLRILSESASARIASPIEIPASRLASARGGEDFTRSSWYFADPWPGGTWRLKDIVEYQLVVFQSIAGHSAQYRERYLRNFYQIGKNIVGRKDWPYAFVIPAEQKDPNTTARLLEILRFGLVEVEKAAEPFEADGKRFSAGSYIVRLQQPYGGWAKTLLERQAYPDLRLYPGGPPKRPYDVAAHTLPLLFDVNVETVKSPFSAGKLAKVDAIAKPAGSVTDVASAKGYRIAARNNSEIAALFDLLSQGAQIRRNAQGAYVTAPRSTVEAVARSRGIRVTAVTDAAFQDGLVLRPPRVAIYRGFAQSMDEGWTRWIFENAKLPYETVTEADIRTGNLNKRYDAVILPDQPARAILQGNAAGRGGGGEEAGGSVPPEFVGGIGDDGLAKLKEFAGKGGTIISLNKASLLITANFEGAPKDVIGAIGENDFYCPGSILRVSLDTTNPIAYGADTESPIFFERSPAFTDVAGAKVVARYAADEPLLSGWLLGGSKLKGSSALTEVPVGQGRVILFGFRPQYRAQSEVTYKLLFNSLLYAAAGSPGRE